MSADEERELEERQAEMSAEDNAREDAFDDLIMLVPGPSTYTAACGCRSQVPGYHEPTCGVFR